MSGGSSRRYPPELRERAVRMVAEVSNQHDSEWAAISEVARLLGVGTAETVRKWVRQAEIDGGSRPGVSTDESAELKRLKRENAELKRANAILKTASGSGATSRRESDLGGLGFAVVFDFGDGCVGLDGLNALLGACQTPSRWTPRPVAQTSW